MKSKLLEILVTTSAAKSLCIWTSPITPVITYLVELGFRLSFHGQTFSNTVNKKIWLQSWRQNMAAPWQKGDFINQLPNPQANNNAIRNS